MDLQLPIDTVEAIAMEMSDGKQCFCCVRVCRRFIPLSSLKIILLMSAVCKLERILVFVFLFFLILWSWIAYCNVLICR